MVTFETTAAFIRTIEETAMKRGAKPIRRIWLKAGSGMCFRGKSAAYLDCILKGTAARGAEICILYGSTAGRCCRCGLVFNNERYVNCPECGGESDRIPLDNSFIIDMVEMES